jgi:hypothetical protein
LLEPHKALALMKSQPVPLSECLSVVETAGGRKRLQEYLDSEPFPHFAPHPTQPGLLIRTEADGKRTTGRFVNREFVPVKVRKTA